MDSFILLKGQDISGMHYETIKSQTLTYKKLHITQFPMKNKVVTIV